MKICKLTIKEHREFRDSTPGDGGTDEDWISYHSKLIAAAVIEPKVDAETVANIISFGDLAELGKRFWRTATQKNVSRSGILISFSAERLESRTLTYFAEQMPHEWWAEWFEQYNREPWTVAAVRDARPSLGNAATPQKSLEEKGDNDG